MAVIKKKSLKYLSYGWCGKILKVDLSSEVITEIDTHPYPDRFLGGRGVATRLYWEYVPATAGAFDPENHTWEFFETLCNMIAYRKGLGEVLAEGLLRAGETLGKDAKLLFANEVAGVGDGATYSAREYPMNGLLYAFEPRQPIAMLHEVSRIIGMWVMNLKYPGSTPVSADVYRAAAANFWRHEKAKPWTVKPSRKCEMSFIN